MGLSGWGSGLWATGGWGMLGWREPRCLGRCERPPSWVGLGSRTLRADHWSRDASLASVLSGANLSLGSVIELAQSPLHSSMLGSVSPTGSVGWAWESVGLPGMGRTGAEPWEWSDSPTCGQRWKCGFSKPWRWQEEPEGAGRELRRQRCGRSVSLGTLPPRTPPGHPA